MSRLLLLTASLLLSLASCFAENANDLLKRASNKIASSKSCDIAFSMSQPGSSVANGKMTISGNKFYINTMQLTTWFDGKTQWTLVKANKEVNVTTPSNEEISQSNPLTIINGFQKRFNTQSLKAPAGQKVVKLTARSKSDPISTAVVTLSAKTLLPSALLLTLSNRQTVSVKISSIKLGNALPQSTFTFNAKKHPGVEIIDLR